MTDTPDPGSRVEAAFRAEFDRSATVCGRAPGRVNLIGEHTDYNRGLCLPIALTLASVVAAGGRADRRLRLRSLQQAEIFDGEHLGPGAVAGWAAYAAGVVWAMREDGIDVPGMDVVVDSSVPLGAGLSSSAALECSVAVAAATLAGLDLDETTRRRLVDACIRAEGEVAGAPTGGMDQTVAMLAVEGHALLLDFDDASATPVPFDVDADLLVVDTRVSHALGDGGYAERRSQCEQAASQLGVRSLREVGPLEVDRLADDVVRRRARHIVTDNARVVEAVEAMRARDVRRLGALFTASHVSLRDDFEVSCAELDAVVDVSLAAGAFGARMTGGGFGGSAIVLLPRGAMAAIRHQVRAAFADAGWSPPDFYAAAAADAAATWSPNRLSGSAPASGCGERGSDAHG